MIRYLTALAVSLAFCFGSQSLALKKFGGRTTKSESNYFSSIARIQTETGGHPQVLLLGSSLTGRLPDRPGFGNLGCDGGSAIVTLRAIDEGVLPAAPVIFIEANTLSYELEKRGMEIGAALRTDWFEIGRKIPNFGATARPTAFVYSWLNAGKSATAIPAASPVFHTVVKRIAPTEMPVLAPIEQALVDDICALFKRVEEKGSRLCIMKLPAGDLGVALDERIELSVRSQSSLPYLPLDADIPKDAVGYTDGRHLDPASAAKVADVLAGQARLSDRW